MPQDNAIEIPKQETLEPMKQTTASDAVNALAAGDTNKFRDAVNDMLGTKVKDYLDVKKLDVAQTFLKAQEVEKEEERARKESDANYREPRRPQRIRRDRRICRRTSIGVIPHAQDGKALTASRRDAKANRPPACSRRAAEGQLTASYLEMRAKRAPPFTCYLTN